MGNLFRNQLSPASGLRLTGFARYTELFGRNLKAFLITNLLTLLGFLPFFAGLLYAILSSSLLVLIPVCVLGGALAGPALSAMYDVIYRTLRDAPTGRILTTYKDAWKRNARVSIVPGILLALMIGIDCFMVMLFSAANRFPGWNNIILLLLSVFILTLFFSIYWPQIVLFEAPARDRIRNSILFLAGHLWKMAGIALLQIGYWGLIVLFLPWSVMLLPLIGFWFILLTANFLIYNDINQAFSLEERIAEAYPEQMPVYETDDMWLERKQREESK